MSKNMLSWLTCAVALSWFTPKVASAQERHNPRCHRIKADLSETRANEGCTPPATHCFLGELQGRRELHATTEFHGDSGAAGPSTSPDFTSYSGVFVYRTDRGTITARETGLTNQTSGNPDSGAITAYQLITSGTGEFADATGYFFVNGFSPDSDHVVTQVSGEVCLP